MRSPHSPSLLLSLAKVGAWLLDSCEELLKAQGGRLASSVPSHSPVNNHKQEVPQSCLHGSVLTFSTFTSETSVGHGQSYGENRHGWSGRAENTKKTGNYINVVWNGGASNNAQNDSIIDNC